jgi:hypothetical protein
MLGEHGVAAQYVVSIEEGSGFLQQALQASGSETQRLELTLPKALGLGVHGRWSALRCRPRPKWTSPQGHRR